MNKIGLKMKQYLYQHTDFSKIEYNKLKLFNDFPLTEKLILAILNCKDLDFINNYLSNVKLINKKEEKTIYTLIGNYDKENKILNKKSKNNLKTLTNNKFLLKELDNRRKMMS